MIEIDLNAPTIPPDQRVWRLFPGSGYQFLEDFREQRVGFLDVPGFEIPEGKFEDAKDLVARVAQSQHIRDFLWSQGPEAKPRVPLAEFARSRATQGRTRIANAASNFFEEAKKGDFVVLPEPTFLSTIWVGRFADNRTVKAFFPRRYGKTAVPARNIRWLGSYPENTISTPLSRALRHQHPFTLLEKSLHLEVFALAYGSFVYKDHFAATVYNDKRDFLDADGALLGAISRLSAAALRSMDNGEDGISDADLADILLRNPPIEYTCTQQVDIHSPGFTRYTAATAVALVISAVAAGLIGLAEHSSADNIAEDLPKMVVTNTASDADPLCTAMVSEASARIVKALGTDRTWALCKDAREAQHRAGLRSSAVPRKK